MEPIILVSEELFLKIKLYDLKYCAGKYIYQSNFIIIYTFPKKL